MKEVLEKLKANSAGKLKAYNQPISADQMAFIGHDLLCSYVIEDGLVRQGVLTISHKDGIRFALPDGLSEVIKSVFGQENSFIVREYPNRGACVQYAFRVP